MANWNLPTVTSGYLDFVTEMNDKFVDAGTVGYGSPTNLPEHAFRYNRSLNIFEEWVASAWEAKVIALSGGGTGGNTATSARANLGIGSMGTQNSNAVNITGGSITGVNFDASGITTGIVPLARGGTGSSLALAPSGHVLLSNGASVGFDSGVSIVNLNANALTQGTVADARLSANVALRNVENSFAARQTFNGDAVFLGTSIAWGCTILNTGSYAVFNMYSGINGPNRKWMRFLSSNGDLHFQRVNDDYTNPVSLFIVSWEGIVNGNGAGLYNLNAANLTGTVPIPVLAGGPVGDTRYFLRNDQTWAIPPGGSGGETGGIPAGLIAMFSTSCPAGWTRVSGLDNRFPLGSTSYGQQGGASVHRHGVGGSTNNAGSHAHGFSGNVSGVTSTENVVTPVAVNRSGPDLMLFLPHSHGFGASFSGNTDGVGDHSHSLNTSTGDTDHTPPYTTVVFCQKN